MVRNIIYNRYFVTFGMIALLAGVWNVYVLFNNNGIISGSIITPNGIPVENAIVVLSEKTLLVTIERDKTITDAQGQFKFSGHNLYQVYLKAYKGDDPEQVAQKDQHLYFRGQNLYLSTPLQMKRKL